ncbi:hypothetical protein Pfo_020519 [Paulownia fortunei]|nr:hypothetical protein Pfo_020519 [Paulownia fortunei]
MHLDRFKKSIRERKREQIEMEMERQRQRQKERKRKRVEKGEAVRADARMRIKEKAEVSPPPSEEEVDEFFAILRRMRVAVKYFEKRSSNCEGGDGGLQAAADGGGERAALDLNAVPEPESKVV